MLTYVSTIVILHQLLYVSVEYASQTDRAMVLNICSLGILMKIYQRFYSSVTLCDFLVGVEVNLNVADGVSQGLYTVELDRRFLICFTHECSGNGMLHKQ